jgi:hypothetical protein
MEEETRPATSLMTAVVDDLQRVAQRLMTLSEEVVARGMTHTEGVDCLIGLVDRMDYACALIEAGAGDSAGRKPEATAASAEPGDPAPGELPDLCQEVRRRAANLDRLNRDSVAAASEIGELAAELTRLEGELRRWQASVNEAPAA